jgi:transcriptional regulator GlxA family with amidase domain
VLSASFEPFHSYANSRSSALPGVEIVRGRHSGPPAAWRFVPMVQITNLQSGSVRIWRGETVQLMAGETVVNAPNCSPRVLERLTPTSRTLMAFIAPRLLEREAGAAVARDLEACVVKDAQVASALESLAQAVERNARARELHAALAALVAVVVGALKLPQARRLRAAPLRPEVAEARRILEQHFDRPVPLDALGAKVGLSKFHLLRLFRDEVGTPPHAYQLQLRISRARELLNGGASPAEVALRCGFADQAHFSRCFKRMVGYTPAAFARL